MYLSVIKKYFKYKYDFNLIIPLRKHIIICSELNIGTISYLNL